MRFTKIAKVDPIKNTAGKLITVVSSITAIIQRMIMRKVIL